MFTGDGWWFKNILNTSLFLRTYEMPPNDIFGFRASGVQASFGQMLLLIAIHFHSNQNNAIANLVCSTLGMKVGEFRKMLVLNVSTLLLWHLNDLIQVNVIALRYKAGLSIERALFQIPFRSSVIFGISMKPQFTQLYELSTWVWTGWKYVTEQSMRSNAAWLNASRRSRVGVGMNRSARG